MYGKIVYIAGPLFSDHERKYLKDLEICLFDKLTEELDVRNTEQNRKRIFFLPQRDAGEVGSATRRRDDVFSADIGGLKRAKIVIALLDGSDIDSGTAVELGYAFAKKDKKIFGLLTDRRRRLDLNVKKRQDDSQKVRLDEGQLDDSQIVRLNNMVWGVCKRGEGIYGSKQSIAKRVKKVVEELGIELGNILRESE